MAFTMRRAPIKPVNTVEENSVFSYDIYPKNKMAIKALDEYSDSKKSLSDLTKLCIKICKLEGVNMGNIKIEIEDIFAGTPMFSEGGFKKEIEKYNKQVKKFEEWKLANKCEIRLYEQEKKRAKTRKKEGRLA